MVVVVVTDNNGVDVWEIFDFERRRSISCVADEGYWQRPDTTTENRIAEHIRLLELSKTLRTESFTLDTLDFFQYIFFSEAQCFYF